MKAIAANFLVLVLSATTAFAQGTVLWDESVNGPISEDYTIPTSLSPMQMGTNSVMGLTEVVPTPPNWEGHPNTFTIEVPIGLEVRAVYLQVDKPNVWAWIGNTGFSSELGFTLSASSGELLAQWGLVTISAGSYGIYLENHDHQAEISIANFRLDFVVQAVPEPSACSILLAGLVLLGGTKLGYFRTRKYPSAMF